MQFDDFSLDDLVPIGDSTAGFLAGTSQGNQTTTKDKRVTKKGASRNEITAAKAARRGKKGRPLRHNENVDPSTALQGSSSIIDNHRQAPRTSQVHAGHVKRCREWLKEFQEKRTHTDPDLAGALDELSDRSALAVELFLAHRSRNTEGQKALAKTSCNGIRAALKAYFQAIIGNRCYVGEILSLFTSNPELITSSRLCVQADGWRQLTNGEWHGNPVSDGRVKDLMKSVGNRAGREGGPDQVSP